MELKSDQALALFEQGYSCAQSVCAAFGPELGVDRETCLALSAGFGAGVSREGEICGALTGAVMVMGLRDGRADETDPVKRKERVYAQTQQLLAWFKAHHQSLLCRNLLGCDLRTEEGRRIAKERDLHHSVCAPLVVEVARWLESLIPRAISRR
ncbi:MAG: C_GCAxxG_C_C family protein [Deltaproteobacteria bacterium]|nr:C_GCAxxG_C_C family protein [Deltaproteobacteria bacterium]